MFTPQKVDVKRQSAVKLTRFARGRRPRAPRFVHFHDGVEGRLKRAWTARKFLGDFEFATECGFGRRQPETLPELPRIHRGVAEQMSKL